MAVERKIPAGAIAIGIVVTALVIFGLGSMFGAAPQPAQQVVVVQPQPAPAPAPAPAEELTDTGTLVVYVKDVDGNRLSNTTVELWTVDNRTAIDKRAFYATEGYAVFDRATTDERGKATFDILAVDYITEILSEEGVALFAVAFPNETKYYREGVEVPEFEVKDNRFIKGKEIQTVIIKVPYIATLVDAVGNTVDLRLLKAGDEKTVDAGIQIGENDKGVIRLYKITIEPGSGLSNATAYISDLTVTIGDKTIDVIKDGEVKLTGSEDIELDKYVELKAKDSYTATVYIKLSADADAGLDGLELVRLVFTDVRDQNIATVSVTTRAV